MSCSNCSKNNNETPTGCKSNGNCLTNGCDQRSVFNWLSNIDELSTNESINVELSFKNGRKSFSVNKSKIPVQMGDTVVVDVSHGIDIANVSLVGELVRHQMQRKNNKLKDKDLPIILRKANTEDLKKWKVAKDRESDVMIKSREIAVQNNLVMKISDVELQADEKKAIFYYTADKRIDFRALVKQLAEEFKTKIEMKQIGARQESSRIGGLGSCGRELCCSTWMTDFRSVNTKAARYQQLSLNPQKLAGQCGKLKCCLNYELDQYIEQVNKFPSPKRKLFSKTEKATHFKTDVFRELMWYVIYSEETKMTNVVCFSIEDVRNIQELNEKNEKPVKLATYTIQADIKEKEDYLNVVGQDDVNRFNDRFKKNKKKKRKKSKR